MRYQKMTLMFIMGLMLSCSDEEMGTLKTDIVQITSIKDIGNAANGSDVIVNFTLTTTQGLSNLQFMVIPSSDFISIDEVASPSPDQIHEISVQTKSDQARLPADMLDHNGQPLANDVNYTLVVFAIIDGSRHINEQVDEFILRDKHILDGRYIGTWDDNLYTNFGISADLKIDQGILSGPFYYSAGFVACCGGSNDGHIRLQIDGQAITSFVYNQSLEAFMGGFCSGKYEGEGKIVDLINLHIDFTGDDCEGPHTDGKIILTRFD